MRAFFSDHFSAKICSFYSAYLSNESGCFGTGLFIGSSLLLKKVIEFSDILNSGIIDNLAILKTLSFLIGLSLLLDFSSHFEGLSSVELIERSLVLFHYKY